MDPIASARTVGDGPADATARPLNIILFSASYPPRVGGLETAVARLAREFRLSGHRVTVVTNRYPRSLARFEDVDGIPVHRILFPGLIPPLRGWSWAGLVTYTVLLPLAPWALLRLWLLLRAARPHVVNVHYLSAPALYVAILSWLRALPARLVISCHGSDVTAPPYPTGSRAASRWIITRARTVTACSADVARHVSTIAPRVPGGAVRIVYNGADLDAATAAAPVAQARPYILSAGRLVELKGMRVVVEALALLRGRGVDCGLIVAGAGPLEQSLRGLVHDLGLDGRVHFAGAVDRARLADLYDGCAVFTLASLREGLGMVCLEAMAHARAVVATRTGGITEIVADGETGLLARPGDPVDLADKLAIVLTDPARADALGRRGRARVAERFTWPAVAARYLASYRTPTYNSAPPPPDVPPREEGRRGWPTTARPDAHGYAHARRLTGWAVSELTPAPPGDIRAGGADGADRVREKSAGDPGSAGVSPVPGVRRPNMGDGRDARAPRPFTSPGAGGGAIPILMYHQVAPATVGGVKPGLRVAPEAFAAQMRLLRWLGWRAIGLTELIDLLEEGAPLPRRRVALTFDDAFLGVARHAVPVLTTLGWTATIFVPTRLAGTCHAPDSGPWSQDKQLMDWDDLRALGALGFDIGAHSRGHPHLPRLAPAALADEVAGSRADIAAALGAPPALFAYPYGEWSPAVAAAVREGGFRAACATHFGRATAASPRLALPRISIGADLDLPHFAYRLARADHLARHAAHSSPAIAGTEGP